MTLKALASLIILSAMLTGCSTIDWQGTGEKWHESLCRDNPQNTCPEKDPFKGNDLK